MTEAITAGKQLSQEFAFSLSPLPERLEKLGLRNSKRYRSTNH